MKPNIGEAKALSEIRVWSSGCAPKSDMDSNPMPIMPSGGNSDFKPLRIMCCSTKRLVLCLW